VDGFDSFTVRNLTSYNDDASTGGWLSWTIAGTQTISLWDHIRLRDVYLYDVEDAAGTITAAVDLNAKDVSIDGLTILDPDGNFSAATTELLKLENVANADLRDVTIEWDGSADTAIGYTLTPALATYGPSHFSLDGCTISQDQGVSVGYAVYALQTATGANLVSLDISNLRFLIDADGDGTGGASITQIMLKDVDSARISNSYFEGYNGIQAKSDVGHVAVVGNHFKSSNDAILMNVGELYATGNQFEGAASNYIQGDATTKIYAVGNSDSGASAPATKYNVASAAAYSILDFDAVNNLIDWRTNAGASRVDLDEDGTCDYALLDGGVDVDCDGVADEAFGVAEFQRTNIAPSLNSSLPHGTSTDFFYFFPPGGAVLRAIACYFNELISSGATSTCTLTVTNNGKATDLVATFDATGGDIAANTDVSDLVCTSNCTVAAGNYVSVSIVAGALWDNDGDGTNSSDVQCVVEYSR